MTKSKIQKLVKDNMMLIILILLVIIFCIWSPNFRSFKNIMNICTQNAYFIIATIGVALIMISGGTDQMCIRDRSITAVPLLLKKWRKPLALARHT